VFRAGDTSSDAIQNQRQSVGVFRESGRGVLNESGRQVGLDVDDTISTHAVSQQPVQLRSAQSVTPLVLVESLSDSVQTETSSRVPFARSCTPHTSLTAVCVRLHRGGAHTVKTLSNDAGTMCSSSNTGEVI